MGAIKECVKRCIPSGILSKYHEYKAMRLERHLLSKAKKRKPYQEGKYPFGINLIGDIQAETGLGQSMRLLAGVLEENEIPFVILPVVPYSALEHTEHMWDYKIVKEPKYSHNLIHINTNDWVNCCLQLGEEIFQERYNIAYWLWELETFPARWVPCMDTVDEIWTPSEFIANCFRKYTQKKVEVIPYGIRIKEPVVYDRSHFRLPEDVFLVLTMYDFLSISERKNPKAAVAAFCKAFSPEKANQEKIGLVIKINHLQDGQELKKLREILKAYENVFFITENLSRAEVEALLASADVLISLHRSEGFGLPMAEAMYLGTPVVATNWSSTAEFMTKESACLVDYELVKIKKDIGPYKKGNRWAEADVNQAAEYLQRLASDKEYHEQISKEGKAQIQKQFNPAFIGDKIKEKLNEQKHLHYIKIKI